MSGSEIITLGCRLNIAESEAIREMAGDQDDLIVVNSCAVTSEAVRQARQAIRRAHRARPDARILVTGCAAQTDPAMFAAMPEVTQVLGNREKMEAASYSRAGEAKVRVADIMAVRDTAPHLASAFADHARAFVEVQNGCDHRCTFCIIPVWPGEQPFGPRGRGDRQGEGTGRRGLHAKSSSPALTSPATVLTCPAARRWACWWSVS
jgi:threonylcarbamoyladenosine tRNA methylthiotransferase MtaB